MAWRSSPTSSIVSRIAAASRDWSRGERRPPGNPIWPLQGSPSRVARRINSRSASSLARGTSTSATAASLYGSSRSARAGVRVESAAVIRSVNGWSFAARSGPNQPSTAPPEATQPPHPPAIATTFVYPISRIVSAAREERFSLAQ